MIPDNPRTTDSETTSEDSPSNQLARNQNEEEEFEQLGLLTQYIGQLAKTDRSRATTSRDWLRQTELEKEIDTFKERYLELIDVLDRASSHQEALSKTAARDRTPARIKIQIKPMVIDKDNPTFVANWEKAVRECERKLTETIINHLKNTAEKTNLTIRATTKETYGNLKTIDPDGATDILKQALADAEEKRQEKIEIRKKRKADTISTATTKKFRKDD